MRINTFFSVMLCLVRAVHKFECRLVINWSLNKWWPVDRDICNDRDQRLKQGLYASPYTRNPAHAVMFRSVLVSRAQYGYSRWHRGPAPLCTWNTGMTSGWCLVALCRWASCGRSPPWCSRQTLSCAQVYRPYTQTVTLEVCARPEQPVARGQRVARYSELRGPQRHLKCDVISPFPWRSRDRTLKKFWKPLSCLFTEANIPLIGCVVKYFKITTPQSVLWTHFL